jgi:NitT/TauT family transport system substrate-binding protein
MMRYARSFLAVAAAAMLVVSGCTSDGAGNQTDDDNGDRPLDEVTYLTGFGAFGREAFAWLALDKGFFEEEGIAATIEPGTGAGDNVAFVTSGQAHFAQADFTGAMILWGGGTSQDFTVVAAVHQNTLTGIISLEGNDISTPTDLEGKTIGDLVPGSVNYLLFPTYANLADIDESTITWENAPPQDLAGLLAQGQVDAVGQFMVGQPLIEGVSGRQAVTLPYSDFITDLYGGVIITSKQLADEDPDLVQRFTRALLRGLEYSIANPEETAEILIKYRDDQNPEWAAGEAELLGAYVRPLLPGQPFGVLEEQRVAQSIAVLEAAGAIPAGITPADLVRFDLVPGAS